MSGTDPSELGLCPGNRGPSPFVSNERGPERGGRREMTMTERRTGQGESQWEAQMQEQLLEALEDYRRGIADAPCVFKWSVLGAVGHSRGGRLAEEGAWRRKQSHDLRGLHRGGGPARRCGVGGWLEAGRLPQEPGVPVGARLRSPCHRAGDAGVDGIIKRSGEWGRAGGRP